MAGSQPMLYYWDTCLFISWLLKSGDKSRKKEELAEIERQIELFDKKLLHIATSVLSVTEALECSVGKLGRDKFLQLRESPNFHLYPVNSHIADLAHDIRNYYIGVNDDFNTFTTPDAIHLATAIFCDANKMYTFDGVCNTPPGVAKRKTKDRKILSVNGSVAGVHSLTIERPWYEPPEPPRNLFSNGDTKP